MKLVKVLAAVAALVVAGQATAASFATSVTGGNTVSVHRKSPCPPIPEAETWAMMGVGLTMLGALARRRMVKK